MKKNLYFDIDTVMEQKEALNALYGMVVSNRCYKPRKITAAITCAGVPMGTWCGTRDELNNLMLTVSSTKLDFVILSVK